MVYRRTAPTGALTVTDFGGANFETTARSDVPPVAVLFTFRVSETIYLRVTAYVVKRAVKKSVWAGRIRRTRDGKEKSGTATENTISKKKKIPA